jgi:hypothetical protein
MKKMVESFEDLEIYRLAEELGDKSNAYIRSIGSMKKTVNIE